MDFLVFVLTYLGGYIGVVDRVLQMRHEHEITGLEPAVMQRVMVHVAEHGARANTVGAVLGVDVFTQLVDHEPTVLLLVNLSTNKGEVCFHISTLSLGLLIGKNRNQKHVSTTPRSKFTHYSVNWAEILDSAL